MIWTVMIVLLLGPLVAWCSMPLDRTALTLFDSQGNIASGEMLGARVGTSLNDAQASLRRAGWRPADPWIDRTQTGCGGRIRRANEQMRIFLDRSWRRGAVCLFYSSDHVAAIAWTFSPLAP